MNIKITEDLKELLLNIKEKRINELECKSIQSNLNKRLKLENNFDINSVKKVAGIDLAYWLEEGVEKAVCCVTVIDIDTFDVIEKVSVTGMVNFPYIPGCLTFRELPLIIEALNKLKCSPDLFVCDGNGYLHPLHMGIASHLGLYTNKPTIGVAKSYYKVNNATFIMPNNKANEFTDILIEGEVYGRAIRTKQDVKPIFLSIGNNIDLNTATTLITRLISNDSHIPVPTRLADLDTHIMRNFYKNQYNRSDELNERKDA